MALLNLYEIFNIIIITIFVAYVLGDFGRRRVVHTGPDYDPLAKYTSKIGFNLDNLKFAIIVTAPAVVLHELAHKFVAMAFGLNAVVEAWGFGIFLGVLLKVIGSPFLIIAPGYAAISGAAPAWVYSLTAFAGPLMNLLLWVMATLVLKYKKGLSHKAILGLGITKQLNMLLFIFNMLPIPPLDGSKVIGGLFGMF
ncbi:M50 family metallopeptidase [Nanoarchaeota archaeon]